MENLQEHLLLQNKMRRGLILTLPKYDDVTEYLSAFSIIIEKISKEKGIFCKLLKGESANKEEFEKVINNLDCKMVVFNGHGSENTIAGNGGNILIKLGENEDLLKNRIVYARSCEAASNLGEKCVNNSEGCFIGYNLPFEFYFDPEWVGNPIKDNTARLFLESSNLAPISIIKGNNSNEAHERSKNQMLKNIRYLLSFLK